MKFAKNQVIEQIRKPKNGKEVNSGKKYESRLRIYTEPKFEDDLKTEEAWKEFQGFMAKAISKERDVRLKDFIQYPLSSCGITKGIMSDIYKVFNAGNSYFNVEVIKKNGGEKLKETLRELNINRWVENQGKKVLKNEPNTIVVIDKGEDGTPYLIPVTNDRLIDFELKENFTDLEYITFIHSIKNNDAGETETRIALYDEETYYVILKKKDGTYTIEKETAHNLGYCPARMFLNERLNSNNQLNRSIPLSLVLSKLQEWQLFDLYKFYTDHYAPFPIIEMTRNKCGNDNCKNGTIYEDEVYFSGDESKVRTTTKECSICKEKNQIGVGAKVLIDPQEDKDEPTAKGTFRFINNDVSQLKYLKEKLESIEEYIKLKSAGTDSLISRNAVNEKQVQGSFESKTNVLLSIKTNLDELYEWIVRTLSKVIIGDKPIRVNANFGTEWYLISEEDLQNRFKTAKETGLPKEEIDMIYYQLIETKYKGNPDKIEKLKMINSLDPCPYETTKTKIEKLKNGIITLKELIISENLVTFVKRFEREHASILEFGIKLKSGERINKIINIINEYTNERITANNA